MKKILFSIGFMAILISYSCVKEDTFEYNLYKPALSDVDSIYFSPGDVSLIADGQAQLKFIVETYRKLKLASGKDTLVFFDYRLLPQGSLKINEEVTGKEVGMTYSTTTIPKDTLKFFASIGTKRTASSSILLRPKPVLPPKVYVDIIFHVWELNPTNVQYEQANFQSLGYQQILDGLNAMNELVNNKIGTNPNGASANIEFRLAAKNPAGQTLPQAGLNRIIYSNEVKTNPLSATIAAFDFPQFIDKSPATYIWDPEKYLNVHVIPSGSGNSLGNVFPAKQLPPGPGETLIPGITGIATGPTDYIRNFVNSTVFLPNTLFFPGYERRIDIFSFIGNFYGLYATSAYTTLRTHSDFCLDTQEFNNNDPRNNFISPIKVSLRGIKFISEYAMDDTRYPSARSSLTLDQVRRMRAVMAKCPGRMNSYK